MTAQNEYEKMMQKMEEHFGDRTSFLGFQVLQLAMSGQPCDITFYEREPLLDVQFDEQIAMAVAYGAGPEKLAEMMNSIKLKDRGSVNWAEIWTINPMPKNGFTEAELADVDLAEGDESAGPDGVTLREMIRDTYHCKSREEEDRFLRRFIAS